MSGLPKYGKLLEAFARKEKYKVEYSEPTLVNGGMAPPPCRGLPGTVCHMVIVTVNNMDFFGFGPSASLARLYAEKDAYQTVVSEHRKESSGTHGNSQTYGYSVGGDVDDLVNEESDLSQNSSDELDLVVSNSQAVTNGSNESNDTSKCTNNGLNCDVDETATSTGEGYCAIPYESAHEEPVSSEPYKVPKTFEELNDVLKVPPPVHHPPNRVTWEHRSSRRRNVIDSLYDVARKKGLHVNFSFKSVGSKKTKTVVVARAHAGGFSAEGRHFRKNMAKCEAAAKLIEVISKLPDSSFHCARPNQSFSPRYQYSSRGGSYVHTRSRSRHREQLYQAQAQEPNVENMLTHDNPQKPNTLSVPVVPSPAESTRSRSHHREQLYQAQAQEPNVENTLTQDTPQTPTTLFVPAVSSPAKSTTSDKPSSLLSLNPVGQMNELLAKEKLTEAVYVFSDVFLGTFTEFSCTVSARGLSAKGVGSSKKLAKRHAAENLLSVMELHGMNIETSVRPKSFVKKKSVSSPSLPDDRSSANLGPNPSPHRWQHQHSPPKAPLLASPSPQHQHSPLKAPLLASPSCKPVSLSILQSPISSVHAPPDRQPPPHCDRPPPPHHRQPPPPQHDQTSPQQHGQPPPPQHGQPPPPQHSQPPPPQHGQPPPPPLPFGPPPNYPEPSSQPHSSTPPHTSLPPPTSHSLPPPLPHHHPLFPTPSRHHSFPHPHPLPPPPPSLLPLPHSLPPPTPHPHWAPHPQKQRLRIASSESESDSGCERISMGLREIIPPSCSRPREEVESEVEQLPGKLKGLSMENGKQSGSNVAVSEANTASIQTSPERGYNPGPIKMRGVRIGSRRDSSQASIAEHPEPRPLRSVNEEPEARAGDERHEDVFPDESSLDPLQFVTRLPLKRHKSWSSSLPRRDQSIFAKLRKREFESNYAKFRPAKSTSSLPVVSNRNTVTSRIVEDCGLPEPMSLPVGCSQTLEHISEDSTIKNKTVENEIAQSKDSNSREEKIVHGSSDDNTILSVKQNTSVSSIHPTVSSPLPLPKVQASQHVNKTTPPRACKTTESMASVENGVESIDEGAKPHKNVLASPPTVLPCHPLLAFAQSIKVSPNMPSPNVAFRIHKSSSMSTSSSAATSVKNVSSKSSTPLSPSPRAPVHGSSPGEADKSVSLPTEGSLPSLAAILH